ncbi:MAG: hypothetical protein HC919_07100 [Oscillatoriales cyanobacterium SM2_2_1]|nr:hypothetical protein [Oscillatoriales cyanobacterium SM2_2_1]
MNDPQHDLPHRTAFRWSLGGWFGSQFGITLWMVLLSVFVWARDPQTGAIAIAGAALLNFWGVLLWRQRRQRSMYVALQSFLVLATLVTAAIVFSLNRNSNLPGDLFLPYWVIAVPVGLMVLFFYLEQSTQG